MKRMMYPADDLTSAIIEVVIQDFESKGVYAMSHSQVMTMALRSYAETSGLIVKAKELVSKRLANGTIGDKPRRGPGRPAKNSGAEQKGAAKRVAKRKPRKPVV